MMRAQEKKPAGIIMIVFFVGNVCMYSLCVKETSETKECFSLFQFDWFLSLRPCISIALLVFISHEFSIRMFKGFIDLWCDFSLR